MKTWFVLALTFAVALLSVPAHSQATSQGSPMAMAAPKYDPATEVTVKGVVQQVTDRECPVSGSLGTHVVLKLGDGKTIEVHIATAKFMKSYDLSFAPGDEIEVLGSRIHFEGVDTILAREIHGKDFTFVFRDKTGKPVW